MYVTRVRLKYLNAFSFIHCNNIAYVAIEAIAFLPFFYINVSTNSLVSQNDQSTTIIKKI